VLTRLFHGWDRSILVLAAALTLLYLVEVAQLPGGGAPGAAARSAAAGTASACALVWSAGVRAGGVVGSFLGCTTSLAPRGSHDTAGGDGRDTGGGLDPLEARESLARVSGRPLAVSIRCLLCLCHVLFGYAQFSGFWQTDEKEDLRGQGLFSVHLDARMEVRPLVLFYTSNQICDGGPSRGWRWAASSACTWTHGWRCAGFLF
jgi:hypothetical protein